MDDVSVETIEYIKSDDGIDSDIDIQDLYEDVTPTKTKKIAKQNKKKNRV